jgi:hypothetical protein
VTKVEVSTRLTESPAALVQSAYGLSPQMQKYYKAQAVLQDDDASALGGQFNQVRGFDEEGRGIEAKRWGRLKEERKAREVASNTLQRARHNSAVLLILILSHAPPLSSQNRRSWS